MHRENARVPFIFTVFSGVRIRGIITICIVFMFNVLGTNWGSADRILFLQVHLVKMLLLWEKQLSMNHHMHLDSHLAKKSGTEAVC